MENKIRKTIRYPFRVIIGVISILAVTVCWLTDWRFDLSDFNKYAFKHFKFERSEGH